MNYSSKLKSPLWQKKRLKILERDGFMCVICFDPLSELHVHHCYYDASIINPWEYPDESLITLCDGCHKDNHNSKIGSQAMILLNYLCRLTDRPPVFVLKLQTDISFFMKICNMTEKEAIKRAFLDIIKSS